MSNDPPKKYSIDGHTFDTQEEFRTFLDSSPKYRNAYTPWTETDDKQLIKLHSEGRSIDQLAKHFKRQRGGIQSRLSKLIGKSISGSVGSEEKKISASEILKAVISGCDPITGEVFKGDSVWSHPQIKSDLVKWMSIL